MSLAFYTLSVFPESFESVMGTSMMRRAQDKGLISFKAFDLRDWTHDRHRTTDDYTYGGGSGLVMKCEPIFSAYDDIVSNIGMKPTVVFMSPHGRKFDDEYAKELAGRSQLLFICGHYEGIDQRAYCLADEVINLGDYVLTSGELASMVVMDAVARKIPGVLGAEGGAEDESFVDGLLEYPQYTRPSSFHGMDVPEVLLSGNHRAIAEWRRHESIKVTLLRRPDLLERFMLSDACTLKDIEYIESLLDEGFGPE